MTNRIAFAILAGCLNLQLLVSPALAENQMGYTLLPEARATQLPEAAACSA